MASTTDAASVPRSRGLHIALWVVQVILAVGFFMSGAGKAFGPYEELAKSGPWAADGGPGLVKFIGITEMLGALGVVIPAATRIKPVLTPLAAVGLLTIMVLAAGVHVRYAEWQFLPVNFVLGAMAAFVAWGRFKKAPIPPRA